jgi:hypothetical protein
MIIIAGTYRWGTKRAACRNDYCPHCKDGVLTEGRRSFLVGHFFWIPLIPLGFQTEWFCSRCGTTPKNKKPTNKFLLIGVLILGLLMTIFLIPPVIKGDEELIVGLVVGLFFVIAPSLLLLLRKRDMAAYRMRCAKVIPLPKDQCPYCGGNLFQQDNPKCHDCNIVILDKKYR